MCVVPLSRCSGLVNRMGTGRASRAGTLAGRGRAASVRRMVSERFLTAVARIEAALDRIETAAQAATVDPELPARHERLRAGTAEALARLDALIAANEGAR